MNKHFRISFDVRCVQHMCHSSWDTQGIQQALVHSLLKISLSNIVFAFLLLFIFIFFGCVGSSLLCAGFR